MVLQLVTIYGQSSDNVFQNRKCAWVKDGFETTTVQSDENSKPLKNTYTNLEWVYAITNPVAFACMDTLMYKCNARCIHAGI